MYVLPPVSGTAELGMEYTVVVEEERVELGAESMVLTLEKDDLLVYQMNQQ